MSAACCIISASTPSRPAVSTITMSSASRRRARRRGGRPRPGRRPPLPGSGRERGTPARSPTTCSWVTALGRCRSQATSSGVWPWPLSQRASLPASVVLPEPCRPASMITVGGSLANRSRRVSPPRMLISSSLTILTTCWAGLSAPETSAPLARSLIRLTKARTTGSATSASSSAMRISRAVASMSASERRPLPRRSRRAPLSRSERVSNTHSEPSRPRTGSGSPVRPRLRSGAEPDTGPCRPSGRLSWRFVSPSVPCAPHSGFRAGASGGRPRHCS